MPFFTVKDGTEVYYKDWDNKEAKGTVVFSHGWPLNSDNWENQMFFLANRGYRVVAHDRRGHGRSDQPWSGNDMNTYADDLLQLLEHLDLKDVMLVGHSTGGGEVARFLGRHGSSRVNKAVLVSAITPFLLKTEDNPKGTPIEVFDSFRTAIEKDRAQFFIDVASGPFFGFNRPGAKVSQGQIWSWWQQGMMAGMRGAHECIEVFSKTDMREDLKRIDIPVLVLHGDDDQIVPFEGSAPEVMKLLKKGTLKVFEGASHALPNMNIDEVNSELLAFLEAEDH